MEELEFVFFLQIDYILELLVTPPVTGAVGTWGGGRRDVFADGAFTKSWAILSVFLPWCGTNPLREQVEDGSVFCGSCTQMHLLTAASRSVGLWIV